MWPTLLQVGGALLGGAMANQGAQAGADAATAANAEAIEEQRRQFNAMLQLMAPAVSSEYARRSVADAFLGIPSSGMGNALNINSLLSPTYAGGSSTPDGSLPTPIAQGNGGLPSLHQMWSGHDPSLYNSIATGNIGNQEWWREGGPSLFHSTMVKATDALGLPNFVDPFGILKKGNGGSAADIWGTPQQNATKAQGFDGVAYLNANPDVLNAFNTSSDRDNRYIGTAFDFDGNGRIDQNEYGNWHYQVHGKGEGRAAPTSSTQQTAAGATPATTTSTATGTTGAAGTTGGMTQQAATDLWKASPFYQSALTGFDKDRKFLEGSAATGGKLLSGATLKALDDRGAYRAADSATTFYNALTNQPTSTNATNLAQNGLNFGNQMSNALRTNGNIQSQLAQTQSANWMRALGGATQAIGESGWLNG